MVKHQKVNGSTKKGIEPTIKADYPEYAYLKLIPRDKTLKEGDQSELFRT